MHVPARCICLVLLVAGPTLQWIVALCDILDSDESVVEAERDIDVEEATDVAEEPLKRNLKLHALLCTRFTL
jgi:hypothetical protein